LPLLVDASAAPLSAKRVCCAAHNDNAHPHWLALPGTIWASGLAEQCATVCHRVQALLRLLAPAPLAVNCVGLSRGGIAALSLAQALGALPRRQLRLRLCLFDPVPGNWYCDPCKLTVARQCADCSSSLNLDKVLAVYPHEKLPLIACHGPLLAKYPSRCVVEEDATLGCHQAALMWGARKHLTKELSIQGMISFERIYSFLKNAGSPTGKVPSFLSSKEIASDEDLERKVLRHFNSELARMAESRLTRRRFAFSAASRRAIIMRHGGKARFLNLHHQQLTRRLAQGQSGMGGGALPADGYAPTLEEGERELMLAIQKDNRCSVHDIACELVWVICAAGVLLCIVGAAVATTV